MNLNNLSAKKICRLVSAGMVFSMLVITGIFGGIMQDIRIFIVGGTLTLCAFFWIWLLVLIFGKRLSHFTSNLCRTLDNMIDGNEELQKSNDSETLFARINHRLIRLYEIMQKNRHKVDMERQELQMLISDISHQVKTPVSNLQMVTDTLLTKPVSEEERMDFLQGMEGLFTTLIALLITAVVGIPGGYAIGIFLKNAGMSTGFVFPVVAFTLFAVAMFMLESLMTILLIHSWKKQSVIAIMRN